MATNYSLFINYFFILLAADIIGGVGVMIVFGLFQLHLKQICHWILQSQPELTVKFIELFTILQKVKKPESKITIMPSR